MSTKTETLAAIDRIVHEAATLLTEMGIPATGHCTRFGIGFNVAPGDAEVALEIIQKKLGPAGLTFGIRPRGDSSRVFAHF